MELPPIFPSSRRSTFRFFSSGRQSRLWLLVALHPPNSSEVLSSLEGDRVELPPLELSSFWDHTVRLEVVDLLDRCGTDTAC